MQWASGTGSVIQTNQTKAFSRSCFHDRGPRPRRKKKREEDRRREATIARPPLADWQRRHREARSATLNVQPNDLELVAPRMAPRVLSLALQLAVLVPVSTLAMALAPVPAVAAATTTAAAAPASAAACTISNVFPDHMVLQRAPAKAMVFGFAAPGTTVKTASFGGASGVADSEGVWRIELPAQPASTSNAGVSVTFSCSSGESLALHDVLFGEVHICGGQSNMQFTLGEFNDAPRPPPDPGSTHALASFIYKGLGPNSARSEITLGPQTRH